MGSWETNADFDPKLLQPTIDDVDWNISVGKWGPGCLLGTTEGSFRGTDLRTRTIDICPAMVLPISKHGSVLILLTQSPGATVLLLVSSQNS